MEKLVDANKDEVYRGNEAMNDLLRRGVLKYIAD